ncbi:HNH endonuclease family protein, partial [Rhodococcus sp. Leaf233]|uniref:HNH endonuclease family protein n=1 Tax=Rhodococcus sp. Leaf233 TaxID=1736302 RepID=UPI00070C15B6
MALSGLLIAGCADPTMASDATSAAQSASSATDTAISSPPPASTTDSVTVAPEPTPASAADSSPDAQAALDMLATLPIKGRAPKTGYDRDLFGQAWTDDVDVEFGRNGCDQRNDLLRRDLADVTLKPGSNGCVVLTGTLADAYTGTTIDFVRGADTSMDVQVDHVVALSNSWQTGAQQLDSVTRQNFANDPRNLQAVDGPANQQKGDGDAATWLPSNKSYRCTYVSRRVEVKAAYGLWVTPPEHDAIVRVLGDCGGNAAAVAEAAPSTEPTPVAPAPA